MTKGTASAAALNCLIAIIGVLQGTNWVAIVGPINATWAVAALAAANVIAHGLTGPAPLTQGTLIIMAANAVVAAVGILQGADWLHIVGPSAMIWVGVILTAINAGAHALTGPDGLLAK